MFGPREAVGERGSVEHGAADLGDACEHPPHLAAFFSAAIGAAPISGPAEAGQRRDRAVHQPQNLSISDLFRPPGQHVAPYFAPATGNDPFMLQFEQNPFQELLRNALAPGDLGNHEAAFPGLRERDKGSEGIFGFVGYHRGAGTRTSDIEAEKIAVKTQRPAPTTT